MRFDSFVLFFIYTLILFPYFIALDHLGFGEYKTEAQSVLKEAKAVAAKKRRGSSRLENLGIPEEELLKQQQALFEKVNLLIFFII